MAKKLYSSDVYGDSIHGKTIEETATLIRLTNEYISALRNVAGSTKIQSTIPQTSQEILNLAQSHNISITAAKELAKTMQQNEVLMAKLELATKNLTDENVLLKKELEQVIRAKKAESEINNKQIGEYQKAVNTLNQLSKSIKDLSIAGMQNTAQFKELQKAYTELYEKVLAADKAVGHFQRNVGNYEMATHRYRYSLFQVQQVLRELPNFAMSARVGFMALSNNLPILADELSKVARSVDENTGKAVGWGNTLKMVAKEMFGWQTLLLVGITMTVQFADKLGEIAKDIFKTNENLKAMNSEANYNARLMSLAAESYVSAQMQILKFTQYIKDAKDGIIDKNAVLLEYNNTLGVSMGKVNSLYELEKKLIEQGPAYVNMVLKKAAADALSKQAGEELAKIEIDLAEARAEAFRELTSKMGGRKSKESAESIIYGYETKWESDPRSALMAIETGTSDIDDLAKAWLKRYNKQIEFGQLFTKIQADIDKMSKQYGFDIFTGKPKPTLGGKEITGKEKQIPIPKEEKDQRLQNDLLRWKVEMDRIDQKRRINEIEAEVDATRLKTIAKSAKEESDIERELKESLIRIKIKANEDKLRLLQDPNYVGYDSVEQIAELTAEISKLRAEIDLLNKAASPEGKDTKQAISSEKANAKSFMDIAKALDQYADSRERMQQTRLQNQINATKRRQEELRLLSAQGVKDAKDNLAMEERKQAELERKQEILQRRQQNRQLVLSAMQTYNSKVQSGDKNALQNTITDLSKLIAFASTLPAFIEGTEDGTVADKLGKPQLNTGQDDYIIRVDGREKIFNPADSAKMAGLTNSTIADLAYNYKVGMMPVISGVDDTKPNPIITELRDLKKAVKEQKPPVMMWNDTDKAMEYKYQQGERMVREIHKTTGIFSTR